jgi:hypothetical protein
VTAFGREGSEVEALLADRYLDSVLARDGIDFGPADSELDPGLRGALDRLRRDLVRVHPSFRFEERLAARLAEAAMALRMPAAAGAEGGVVPFRSSSHELPPFAFDPLADADPENDRRELARPLLIGGALASAGLSLAGAALVAWRLARPGRSGAMARAARAVREARLAAAMTGRLD